MKYGSNSVQGLRIRHVSQVSTNDPRRGLLAASGIPARSRALESDPQGGVELTEQACMVASHGHLQI